MKDFYSDVAPGWTPQSELQHVRMSFSRAVFCRIWPHLFNEGFEALSF
jgi:hypothetical protein